MTLREMREAAGLTQEACEARSGLRQSQISALEKGRVKNPTMDTLGKLAAAYDRPIDEVIAAVRETVAEAAA